MNRTEHTRTVKGHLTDPFRAFQKVKTELTALDERYQASKREMESRADDALAAIYTAISQGKYPEWRPVTYKRYERTEVGYAALKPGYNSYYDIIYYSAESRHFVLTEEYSGSYLTFLDGEAVETADTSN